jgi:hypothetical protein
MFETSLSARPNVRRIQAELSLLGALLEGAEKGWPSAPLDMRPDELLSDHAAATYQQPESWADTVVPSRMTTSSKRSSNTTGLTATKLPANCVRYGRTRPNQQCVTEWVRRPRKDNARIDST